MGSAGTIITCQINKISELTETELSELLCKIHWLSLCVYVFMCLCVYVFMCLCVYVLCAALYNTLMKSTCLFLYNLTVGVKRYRYHGVLCSSAAPEISRHFVKWIETCAILCSNIRFCAGFDYKEKTGSFQFCWLRGCIESFTSTLLNCRKQIFKFWNKRKYKSISK